MFEVFNFNVFRNPRPYDESQSIKTVDTEFINQLEEMINKEDGSKYQVINEADNLLKDKSRTINFKDQYLEFFESLQNEDFKSTDDLGNAFTRIFDRSLNSIVTNDQFRKDKETLSNFLNAVKIVNHQDAEQVRVYKKCYRVINFLEHWAQNESADINTLNIPRWLTKPITLSKTLIPLPWEKKDDRSESWNYRNQFNQIKDLKYKARDLQHAIDRLMSFRSMDFTTIQLNTEELETANPNSNFNKAVNDRNNNLFKNIGGIFGGNNSGLPPAQNPTSSKNISKKVNVLREERINQLDEKTRGIVEDYGLDLKSVPVPDIVDKLTAEREYIGKELSTLPSYGNVILPDDEPEEISRSFLNPPENIEKLKVGIKDLMVVKEHIKGYEAKEIGHVENAMEGEHRRRVHETLRRSEETFIQETETTKETKEELITTERFELQTETSKTLREQRNSKFGLQTSLEYNSPMVNASISASYEQSSSQSVRKSQEKARTFAKETTEKAAKNITERKREKQISKVIRETEEKNVHGIDNKDGEERVVGIYQWLTKIHSNQLFRYGKRMMFDFIIPDPAAFVRYAFKSQNPEVSGMDKPDESFEKVSPEDLSENPGDDHYYLNYVKKYGVQGVDPPPREYISRSVTFDGKSGTSEGNAGSMKTTTEVDIDDGYEAVEAIVVLDYNYWSGSAAIDLFVDEESHTISGTSYTYNDTFNLDHIKGSVPVALNTYDTSVYIANVRIRCKRTPRKLESWKIETYNAIRQKYEQLKSDYYESLKAAKMRSSSPVEGRNPEENRRIERTELKKHALSMLTGQHFEAFGSMVNVDAPDSFPSGAYPRVDIDQAISDGTIIRFFEWAFEWENLQYVLYPYFWSNQNKWINKVLTENNDPMFAEFLRSGAARVSLPVNPGYEKQIEHFLETGNIPASEELLELESDLYKSIVEEMREGEDIPEEAEAVGEPWEVEIPTDLVRLRKDASLPRWKKVSQNGNGWEWKPVSNQSS